MKTIIKNFLREWWLAIAVPVAAILFAAYVAAPLAHWAKDRSFLANAEVEIAEPLTYVSMDRFEAYIAEDAIFKKAVIAKADELVTACAQKKRAK